MTLHPEDLVTPRKRAKRNIGALPKHLERTLRVIEPASLDCPCCAGALHRIGEDMSEALDWVPAIIRVIRTVRPKHACRHCQGAILRAPAPKRMIEGGMTTTSMLAWVATAKFRLVAATQPPDADAQRSGCDDRPFDTGGLDEANRLVG